MKTWSGLEAPLYPGAGTVSLLDLVVQLGRQRRFGGVGSTEWTVLHHSVLVALLWLKAGFPVGDLHSALLHDAHEAYTGDIPGPVKHSIRTHFGGPKELSTALPAYLDPIKKMEAEIDVEIRKALDLAPAPDDNRDRRLKICDMAALVVEGVFFGAPGCDCSVDVPPHLNGEVYGLIKQAFPGIVDTALRLGRDIVPLYQERDVEGPVF